jgi:hypothetical protein
MLSICIEFIQLAEIFRGWLVSWMATTCLNVLRVASRLSALSIIMSRRSSSAICFAVNSRIFAAVWPTECGSSRFEGSYGMQITEEFLDLIDPFVIVLC